MATGVDAVGMDASVSPEVAASLLPSGTTVQGNLDPLAVLIGGEEMKTQTRETCARMSSGR